MTFTTHPVSISYDYDCGITKFFKGCKKLFSEDDKRKLYTSLANNPEQGDIIQGTSGVRKMRFALGNKGKSGGSRVIYYYHISDLKF